MSNTSIIFAERFKAELSRWMTPAAIKELEKRYLVLEGASYKDYLLELEVNGECEPFSRRDYLVELAGEFLSDTMVSQAIEAATHAEDYHEELLRSQKDIDPLLAAQQFDRMIEQEDASERSRGLQWEDFFDAELESRV